MILYDSSNKLIGVQVKRNKGEIEASQIRELVGALVLGEYTKGIFVTTSKFHPGAKKTAKKSTRLGIVIDLINGTDFYQALQISQRNVPCEIDSKDIDSFYNAPSQIIARWDYSEMGREGIFIGNRGDYPRLKICIRFMVAEHPAYYLMAIILSMIWEWRLYKSWSR